MSVLAVQLHQAGSARLTPQQACSTGLPEPQISWHLHTACVQLFLRVSMPLCRNGAGVPLAPPLKAGAKDLPAAYQRLRRAKRGVWQRLIVC